MTPEELERTVRAFMESDLKLMMRKNHDYSAAEDALSNFRDFGWRGVVVRIGDKYNRLKEIAKGKKPKNESVVDSLIDIRIYSYIGEAIFMEGIKEEDE